VLVGFEKHWTKSDKERAYAVAAFVSRILNSVLVLLAVNAQVCARLPVWCTRRPPGSSRRWLTLRQLPLLQPDWVSQLRNQLGAQGFQQAKRQMVRAAAGPGLGWVQPPNLRCPMQHRASLCPLPTNHNPTCSNSFTRFQNLILAGSYRDFSPGWWVVAGAKGPPTTHVLVPHVV
jgi:hypothetical protein